MPITECPAGVRLLEYLTRKGFFIPAFCDGNGACGRCRIRLLRGSLPVTPSDRSFLKASEIADGWRLACCAVTQGAVTVEIPAEAESTVKPLHTAAADRAAKSQRTYALAVTADSAALVDLTGRSVVGIGNDADTLLAKYPDAADGLSRVVSTIPETDGAEILSPEEACRIVWSGDPSEYAGDAALEGLICLLFR